MEQGAGGPFSDAPAALLADYGVTRVGDLTGLDRIGIPVWFACRPNARALSVSQGKGLTHAQARISATMEAVECAVAERPRAIARHFGSLREMERQRRRIVPLDAMRRCRPEKVDPDRERAWVEGLSAVSGEPVLAPFELVGLDLRTDFPWDRAAFTMSSEGLASGPDADFATLRAILELVENDATSLIDSLGLRAARSRRIDLAGCVHPGLNEALAHLDRAGLEATIVDLGGPAPVPVVGAFIGRMTVDRAGPARRVSAGFACRLDPAEAALAALLEAVQSRLTQIAGVRDDLTAADFCGPGRALPRVAASVTLAELQLRSCLPADPSPRAQMDEAVRRLTASGVPDIFLFALSSRPGAHVVRALAASLEGSADGPVQSIGQRGLARLLAGAA